MNEVKAIKEEPENIVDEIIELMKGLEAIRAEKARKRGEKPVHCVRLQGIYRIVG